MGINRRLTFYGWADTNEKHPFQRLRTAQVLGALDNDAVVVGEDGDTPTAVEVASEGDDTSPTQLVLHALHGPESRPSEWGPGEGTRTIQIGDGRFTAFTSHVLIWGDKIAAVDMHANSPGLGRLSSYFWKQAKERVAFRPLYQQGTAEKLKDLDGIRGVDFSIHDPHKIAKARGRGMLRSLLPQRKFPSVNVSAGMSRKQPRDAYLDGEVAAELYEIADEAEKFFDRIVLRGLSKSDRTKTGRKKSVEVNLLSERLQIEVPIDSDPTNASLPGQSAVFAALEQARTDFSADSQLQDAVEARLSLDEQT